MQTAEVSISDTEMPIFTEVAKRGRKRPEKPEGCIPPAIEAVKSNGLFDTGIF